MRFKDLLSTLLRILEAGFLTHASPGPKKAPVDRYAAECGQQGDHALPNHVTNRCRLEGTAEDIAAFMELMIVEGEEYGEKVEAFDFERLVQMPESLKEVEDSTNSNLFLHILRRDAEMLNAWSWMNQFRNECLGPFADGAVMDDETLEAHLEAVDPAALKSAKAMVRSLAETGYISWYDWSIAKWGTKWNAYSFSRLPDEPSAFKFDTAWAPPVRVFKALAERFPNLGIYCASFDEGWGFACEGWFNPPEGESEYSEFEATDELYEKVYGAPPERDEDEDEDEDSEVDVEAQSDEADEDEAAKDEGDKPIWSA
jgi:hypothetical protein